MDQEIGRRRYLAALKSGIRLRNSWGRDDVVVNLALKKTPFGEVVVCCLRAIRRVGNCFIVRISDDVEIGSEFH